MLKYSINYDKVANMLTSVYQRGRRHILWIQALLKPLQTINDEFQSFVVDKKLEASVTSQVIHLEWYLNYKLRKYYVNQYDGVKFNHYVDLGVLFFDDGDLGEIPNVAWDEYDDWTSFEEDEQPKPMYYESESAEAIGASFNVIIPEITIPFEDFEIIIRAEIDKYRIAGKTYTILNT